MGAGLSIGRYQLENLLRASVRFQYLDLRSEEARASQTHFLLYGSQAVLPSDAVSLLKSQSVPFDAGVILICEDGSTSAQVATDLEAAGFVNVYRVEGGLVALG